MAVWSRVLRPTTELFARSKQNLTALVPSKGALRWMSDEPRTITIRPTRWQWLKGKDLFHFYIMLGVIPWTIIITCVNVFIGPATLKPIPEGYNPKPWEYEQHPISRFLMRYFVNSPQQEYEKNLANLYITHNAQKIRRLEDHVRKNMSDYHDYQAYYYRHFFGAKYIYQYRMNMDAMI